MVEGDSPPKPAVPRLDAVEAGWAVLLFGLLSAVVAAVIAGILPAYRASRLDPIQVLKGAGLLSFPVIDGRDIRSSDDGKAPPVAVVNKAFADRYFPGSSAVGRKFWTAGRARPATEIVGVVANSRTADLTQSAEPEIYLSLWQASAFSKHLLVRTAADPRAVMGRIRNELHSVLPTAAVENMKTLDEVRDDSLATRRFAMQLLAGFSLIGSVLTLVGVYGVLSLSVASRRRELAIRAAVGAEARDIRNLIFGEGFRLIAVGIAAGWIAATAFSRVLRVFLFAVEPADPLTQLGVGCAFALVAMLACWIPARRATAADPVQALRYE